MGPSRRKKEIEKEQRGGGTSRSPKGPDLNSLLAPQSYDSSKASLEDDVRSLEQRFLRSARRDRLAGIVFPMASLAIALLGWLAVVQFTEIPRYILPPPEEVLIELAEDFESGFLMDNLLSTLLSVLLGYFVAVFVGILFGIVMARSKTIYRFVYPPIVAAQGTPKSALAPLFLIWFGIGLMSKVVIAMLIAFFPIVISTFHGLRSVPPEYNKLGKSLGYSKTQMFLKIQFPSALPEVFSGLKVGIALSVVGAIVAEFVASNAGLGYMLIVATSQLNTASVFGVLLVLAVIGIVLFTVIQLLERLVIPWHVASGRERTDVVSA